MADISLAQSYTRWVESSAYREAGHITAAVLQEVPLQERGIHIDTEGWGISYYRHRAPGDLAISGKDQRERERTIIALCAGPISQRTFFPECPEEDWASDWAKIYALLEEMHQAGPAAQSRAQHILWSRAEELVPRRWSLIESIEKWMRGSEIVEFFKNFQIIASTRGKRWNRVMKFIK